MNDFFLMYCKPVKFFVLITLIHALINLKLKNKIHLNLFIILVVSFITELGNPLLSYNHVSTGLFITVSVIIHHTFWLFMIKQSAIFKKLCNALILGFLFFSFINVLLITGLYKFNYYTFVVGAFLYISIFIYESFYRLKKEEFSFFISNNYLLLFSPVIFFFGFSFMFAFESSLLTGKFIIGNIMLYDVVMNFVNIIYYTLINIYIYRERKLKHA